MKLDLVDVFGSRALAGNPLAVVHCSGSAGAEALDTEQMLALTRWLGFSETTFLLPATDPAADYRVRIFYPGGELDFAGHPTLGTCFAWLTAGWVPRTPGVVVQQFGIGLVPVRQEADGTLAFAAPPMRRVGPLTAVERTEATRLAGVPETAIVEACWADNGPPWQLLVLKNAEAVLAAKPLPSAPEGMCVALAGPTSGNDGVDWELRAFFADQHGVFKEDPVTGSLNAGVASRIFAQPDTAERYGAAQGSNVGADGRITWARDALGSVWIGGRCDMIAAGAQLDGPGGRSAKGRFT